MDFPADPFSSGAPADETPLEMTLRLALEDGTYRKAFYQELLLTNLVVITGVVEGGEESHRAAEPGELFGIVTFGEGLVPVFSTRERIFDSGPAKHPVQTLELPARKPTDHHAGEFAAAEPVFAAHHHAGRRRR